MVLGTGREIGPFLLYIMYIKQNQVSHVAHLILFIKFRLFLSEEHLYRASEEIEVAAKLVLQEAAVRFADILRKVAEECERW